MKRLVCALFGHRLTPVSKIPGSARYYSHPRGSRRGCRRCRLVLPKEEA